MAENYSPIRKVAVFGSVHKKGFAKAASELLGALVQHKIQIYLAPHVAEFLRSASVALPPKENSLTVEDLPQVDMAMSLGGDGTFLKTALVVGKMGIPILGINLGNLGFLVDVSGDEISAALEEIFKEGYQIEERSVLQLKTPIANYSPDDLVALNEIAILKQDTSSMIKVHTSVNHEYLCTYRADGLLVSTPTGSTAYALSVGASIMVPQNNSVILSPVAPHSLNLRPVIIPDHWQIDLDVESRKRHFLVSLDGRSIVCSNPLHLTITQADYKIRVAKRKGHTYFQTLREKLMWGADARLDQSNF